MSKTRTLLAALGLSVFVVGCGGGGGGQTSGNKTAQAPASGHSATDASHAPAGGQAAAPASGGAMNAVIRGTIAFEGTAAKGEALKMDADPVCKGLHSAPVTSQDVVVNANNTLRWVMVYVKDGLGGHTFPTPTEPVMIDQKGCVYDPHVIGMMANQPVKILNSDETLHNIHAMPKVNTGFNIGMPRKGMEQTKTFKEPEVPIHIKCDVHKWMSSYVGVFSHPFYGVTGENGSFELKGLPAGTYTIEAWHEKFGTQQASVTVGEAETKDVSFTFKAPA